MATDYGCSYCEAVFPKRMDNGACPCCGAPNPKRLEETPTVTVINNYHYVERSPGRTNVTSKGYYLPPKRNLKSKLYSTLGFKLATGLFVIVAILAIYLFVQAFKVGEKSNLTNEELRQKAPTAQVIDAANAGQDSDKENWLDKNITSWLTSAESVKLRDETGVINLIVLDTDEIKIAENATLELDGTWSQRKPYFVEAVSINGTAVVVQIGGIQYNINAFQPFVWQGAAHEIVMVDVDGTTWVKEAEDAVLVELNSFWLPYVIDLNPNMEIAFSKQQ